ncbi:hypothetical protein FRB99_006280, partial [Tulasnella sp. 403]
IENFRAATELDNYLAIAYFQAGVSNFLLGQFEFAFQDFEDAFQYLRGNEAINYEQIGLKYQLYSAAVLFNQGITMLNLGDVERGMQLLQRAYTNKSIPEHDVIDDAIEDKGEGYSVFSIPVGVLYRPNEKMVANLQARDWMGKARLISNTMTDTTTEFAASEKSRMMRAQTIRSQSRSRAARGNNSEDEPKRSLEVPSLTRSRSATSAPRDLSDDPIGPPRATVIGRSASAGSPSMADGALSGRSTPRGRDGNLLPAVQPLALGKARSIRIVENKPRPSNDAALGLNIGPVPITRRPTLKISPDVEMPPSPPQSRTPPQSRLQMAATKGVRSQYGDSGIADIYDTYLEADDSDVSTALPRGPRGLDRKMSQRTMAPTPPPKMARSNTLPPSRMRNGSDDMSNGGPASFAGDDRLGAFEFEMRKIRVKLFFGEEVRGMVVSPDISFSDFLTLVCAKFSYEYGGLRLKFEDEDGSRVSLRDDGDWDMAVETARGAMGGNGSVTGNSKGEAKLIVWCEEDYR